MRDATLLVVVVCQAPTHVIEVGERGKTVLANHEPSLLQCIQVLANRDLRDTQKLAEFRYLHSLPGSEYAENTAVTLGHLCAPGFFCS